MTINGRRNFTYKGRKFYVQDNPKRGRKNDDDNYFLSEEWENGMLYILYERYSYDIPKFKTIKDAQRYVRDYEFLIVKEELIWGVEM